MKTLIINADDYGRTADISRGIRHSHLNGIVTTTTTMMNYATAQDDLKIAMEQCPKLGLGVHLTLTSGNPVLPGSQIPTLTNPDGSFFKLNQLGENFVKVNPNELKAEWRAQIEKFLATGATIDHIDSHHHTSYYTEPGFAIMLDLANEYGAPVRRPRAMGTEATDRLEFTERLITEKGTWCPQNFIVSFYDEGATLANLISIINNVSDGLVTEVMSHPGYVDEDILTTSSYNRQREGEIAALTDPKAREAIAANNITLATFRSAK
jgi:chitin disaccharide deacetylase